MSTPLLQIKEISKHFQVRSGILGQTTRKVRAVDQVSFDIARGQTLGLIGESGCGKSTLGRTVLRLLEPSEGEIHFEGYNITHIQGKSMRKIRHKMQIIFQDPYASLNPRMNVKSIIEEPMEVHGLYTGKTERKKRIQELLGYVQLSEESLLRYPHEFSGGQRQRICIARALACEPIFIVCDEAVSALDVSIQAQIINLLMNLQKELGLTYLFIGHNLRIVEFISHRIAVMYLGKIVEIGDAKSLYTNPRHPYTKALISSIPVFDPNHRKKRIILHGDVSNSLDLPNGCHFNPRCLHATDKCRDVYPSIEKNDSGGFVRCHNPLY